MLEDMTLEFPVDGAPARRSLSGSQDRHCLAAEAHFSEGDRVEKDIIRCMAIPRKSCHFSKSVPSPLATLHSPTQINLAPS